jgi:hypothetical protein
VRHTESERGRDSGRLWEDSRGLAWRRRSTATFTGEFGRTVDGIVGMCLQECALALLPVVLARCYATLSDQRQRQLLRRLFLRVKELPNGMHGSEHGNRRERALAQRRSGRARKGDPRGLRTSRSLNDSRELGVRRIGRPSVAMSRVSCSERPLLPRGLEACGRPKESISSFTSLTKRSARIPGTVPEMTNPVDLFVGNKFSKMTRGRRAVAANCQPPRPLPRPRAAPRPPPAVCAPQGAPRRSGSPTTHPSGPPASSRALRPGRPWHLTKLCSSCPRSRCSSSSERRSPGDDP